MIINKPEAYSGSMGWRKKRAHRRGNKGQAGSVGSQAGSHSLPYRGRGRAASSVLAPGHGSCWVLWDSTESSPLGISYGHLLNSVMLWLFYPDSNWEIILELQKLHSSSNPVVIRPGGASLTLNVCVKNEGFQDLKRFWLRGSGQAKGMLILNLVPLWMWCLL